MGLHEQGVRLAGRVPPRLAAACGAAVCHFRRGDAPPDGRFDAFLYDLDDVPSDQRRALLEEVCLNPPARPVAVHGYGIADEQAAALRPGHRRQPGVGIAPHVLVPRGRGRFPETDCSWKACSGSALLSTEVMIPFSARIAESGQLDVTSIRTQDGPRSDRAAIRRRMTR